MDSEMEAENAFFKAPIVVPVFSPPPGPDDDEMQPNLQPQQHLQFKINAPRLKESAISSKDDDEQSDDLRKITKISKIASSELKSSPLDVDIPYKEPAWSGPTNARGADAHFLEILKNGCIVGSLNITEKPYYVFGRQVNCDFQLEHPSASRYHAVLQHRTVGDMWEIGWYLYDLGSTHGSFVNRERIPPHMHIRLKVGYVFKFGGSSRMYILQGPDEDMEAESPLTVTEIKQKAEKQKLAMSLSKIKAKLVAPTIDEEDKHDDKILSAISVEESDSPEKIEEVSGINWGMVDEVVEDDDEDEEGDEGEKIDFEEMEKREQFYIEDPRKALKNFFDREGVELKYEFSERGNSFNRQWSCTIELPVETNTGKAVFAEASVSGGKKEAFAACALEACRMLDAYGVLRKSNQESRKRKIKRWEDDDFYDSDEDTFTDRTGELERKREKRMRRSTEDQVDNFSTLNEKLNNVEEDIKRVQRQLSLLHAELRSEGNTIGGGSAQDARDSLDSYMSDMARHDAQAARVQSSKLRLKMGELRKEAERLKKLIKITKPVDLPPLKQQAEDVKPLNLVADGKKFVMTGSIKGRRFKKIIQPLPPPTEAETKKDEIEKIEKLEGEPEVKTEDKRVNVEETAKGDRSAKKMVHEQNVKVENVDDGKVSTCGDVEDADKLIEVDREAGVSSVKSEKIKQRAINKTAKREKRANDEKEKVGEYDASDPDYAVWLPPEDQAGDGKTSLNAKFGY